MMTIGNENDNTMASSLKQTDNSLAGGPLWTDTVTTDLDDSGNDGDYDIKSVDTKEDKLSSQTSLAQKRRFADVKPPYSYIALITMALESSTSGENLYYNNNPGAVG